MINLWRIGQGPRPDLLEKELKQKKSVQQDPRQAGGSEQPEKKKKLKVQHKDRAAMIIALFQLVMPWIIGGILIFLLVIFLVTRI
ncbi:MAG: hypothetical protein LKJ45_06060 [Oscillospiraceae bacterium]|jgi:hypothetical protein|nr:hypothetical protein [Oscillospiraceae bacterium]